jgi:DHA1 family bicyclomycin/chloramphenicol resistance-like MFS transporter
MGTLVGVVHDGSARPLTFIMAACGVGAWLAHRLLIVPLEKRSHPLH